MAPNPLTNRWCWSRAMVRSIIGQLSLAAVAARRMAHRQWLPKYAPELNDIEAVWHNCEAHHLAHHTFADADVLDQGISAAVKHLYSELNTLPFATLRTSA